jgi:ABC-type multidrug transport system ATPase subunit
MPSDFLEVSGVLHRIGNRNILTDIYIGCYTGEIIGLLGRNGCGKSTLLKIIFGSLPNEDKNIRINGTSYPRPFSEGNLIAYLPQKHFLPPYLSIHRLISIFIRSPAKRKRIIEDERITAHLQKKVGELSGGTLRYLEIILLLNLDTCFVLLDEPFSGVEPIYKDIIKMLLKEYSHDKGFIITDHDYGHILEISTKIILLTNGVCKSINGLEDLKKWNYLH